MSKELGNFEKVVAFIISTICGSVVIAFSANWYEGMLEEASGFRTGMLLSTPISGTDVYAAASCILLILASAWAVHLRISRLNCAVALAMTAFALLVVFMLSQFAGTDKCDKFLDGFKSRLVTSGVESNAVLWARKIFSDQHLNTNNVDEIDLSRVDVPKFFGPLFAGGDPPTAIIYYGRDRTKAQDIEVRESNGIDWGLLFVNDTNSLSTLQLGHECKNCGNGLYVFYHFYK